MSSEYYNSCPLNKLYIKKKSEEKVKNLVKFNLKEGGITKESVRPSFPENPEALNKRTASAFQKIVDQFTKEAQEKKDRILLIVSHGVPVKGMLTHAMGKMITDKTDYTCIS
mmetsp:Transcript_19407/g.16622  ORF Transcript_19407/g.16622 Transcript_19407/m.16622 type:complete len:112 (-) Transcript_19407:90-425(-)